MAETKEKELSSTENFLQGLAPVEGNPLEASDRITAVRDEARQALPELEFPTTKVERWKYTRVNKVIKGDYAIHPTEEAIDIKPYLLDEDCDRLVFVNGFFREDLSQVENAEGIHLGALSQAEGAAKEVVEAHYGTRTHHTSEPFTALNAVYATDGALVHIGKDQKAERPIQILNLIHGEGRFANPHHLVVAEEGSEAQLYLSYHSLEAGKSFNNAVNEYIVKQNAKLAVDKLQYEEDTMFQIATDQAYQERDSRFGINTITLSGGLVRNDLNIDVDASNCETLMHGLFVEKGKQHVDNHTVVNHLEPDCYSNELYKGILYDNAEGVFNGKIHVFRDAQRIDAYQSNGNILLGDKATVHAKPELEIYADDVTCSHGSTTGQLDENALFYLRARGLGEDTAKALLVHAFASEVLDTLHNEKVKEQVIQLLRDRYDWNF